MSGKKIIALFLLILIAGIPVVGITKKYIERSVWDGSSNITIAVDNGDIHVWSVSPSTKQLYEVILPKQTYMSVDSYGAYRAGAIGRLSLLETKNGDLFAKALEESLGVSIDAVVVPRDADEKEQLDLRTFLGFTGSVEIINSAITGAYISNLTGLDMIRLWLFSFQLRKESIEVVNIDATSASSEITLPDGSKALVLDKQRFAKEAAVYFSDERIKEEKLTIEVHNATGVDGQADKFAFMMGNIGGNVINTVKKDDLSDQTVVYSENSNYTAYRIAKIIKGRFIQQKPSEGRADILVVLGKK